MLARIHSAATLGLDARVLDVEVDASARPSPLHDRRAARRDRPRGARARPLRAPKRRASRSPAGAVTVNLAPADFRKCGAALDLAGGARPALALRRCVPPTRAAASSSASSASEARSAPIRGALCLALAARDAGFPEIVLPAANAPRRRRRSTAIRVVPRRATSREAVEHVLGEGTDPPADARRGAVRRHRRRRTSSESAASDRPARRRDRRRRRPPPAPVGPARRAARRCSRAACPASCPPLTREEAIEVTRIHSVAGVAPAGSGPRGAAALPRAASRHLGAGPRRRRRAAGSRRDLARAPRRALPRRAPRVPARRARGDPPAARGAARHGRPRRRRVRLPVRLPPRGRDEPVSLRLPAAIRGARARAIRASGAATRASSPGRCSTAIDLHVAMAAVAVAGPRGDAPPGESSADPRARARGGETRADARRPGRRGFRNADLTARGARRGTRARSRRASVSSRRAVTRLDLSVRAVHRALRVARTIADLDANGRSARSTCPRPSRFGRRPPAPPARSIRLTPSRGGP